MEYLINKQLFAKNNKLLTNINHQDFLVTVLNNHKSNRYNTRFLDYCIGLDEEKKYAINPMYLKSNRAEFNAFYLNQKDGNIYNLILSENNTHFIICETLEPATINFQDIIGLLNYEISYLLKPYFT